jgi:hypothetical protein
MLNEGMRYRDFETGTFLTRYPIGYGDGPNVYCYVHCNPIMSFDPLGLFETEEDAQTARESIEALEKDEEFSSSEHGQATIDKLWEMFGGDNGREGSGLNKDGSRMNFGDLSAEKRNGAYSTRADGDPKDATMTFDNSLRDDPDKLSATAAHEGTHGVQHDKAFAEGRSFVPSFDLEVEAYTVQFFVSDRLQGLRHHSRRQVVEHVKRVEPGLASMKEFGMGGAHHPLPGIDELQNIGSRENIVSDYRSQLMGPYRDKAKRRGPNWRKSELKKIDEKVDVMRNRLKK